MASAEEAPSDEQLAGLVLRAVAAIVALTLAGGIAAAAGRLRDDEPAALTADVRDLRAGGGIGPLPGTDVAAYTRSRAAALQDATGRRAAVVSFAGYRTAVAARALLARLGVDAVGLLVALPGGRPVEVDVDADLAALAARQREEATAEKAALEQLLPTVVDPDFQRQYRADIDRLTAQLASSGSTEEVVFGAVVVDAVDDLRALAAEPGIRLVDVGPDGSRPPRSEVAALRPEEAARAGAPPTRPSRP